MKTCKPAAERAIKKDITLPPGPLARLDDLAHRYGLNRSRMIAYLVNDYYDTIVGSDRISITAAGEKALQEKIA